MRILTRDEMDQVFGGQSSGTVATSLPTVKVTGVRVASGDYFTGSDFGGGYQSYNEYSSGHSGGSHSRVYPAIPPSQLPSSDKVRCSVNAAAAAAGLAGMEPGWGMTIVNSYGYQNVNAGAQGYKDIQLYEGRDAAIPNTMIEIRGLAAPTVWNAAGNNWTGGTVTIYAAAFEDLSSGFRSAAYYDSTGTLVGSGTTIGAVDLMTHSVLVAAHEARHTWQFKNTDTSQWYGTNNEADAETYALKVLDSYRAGNKGSCN
ncbi:hypothetical protein [Xanthomonas vasicola]|uniref:hypothetical protein n=1 Tax=Xanthomonas vasicola TaxID=56459 RepID=UPI001015DD5E|nr:hypothetical protein [Xanthomonas vasicola]